MKYLVIYILFVFLLYVYLKYYCYEDQKNILNSKKLKSVNDGISEPHTESLEKFSILPYKTFKPFCNFRSDEQFDNYDDFEYPLKKLKSVNEYYSNGTNGSSECRSLYEL